MNLIRKNLPRLALAVGACCLWARASADDVKPDDEIQVTVGLKAWSNYWSSWTPWNQSSGTSEVLVPLQSTTQVSMIPVVNVRYRDAFASASALTDTSYTLSGPQNGPFAASRSEYDVNLGYYVLPRLGISVGYKKLRQDYGNSLAAGYGPFTLDASGPTIGLNASAPVAGALSLYGVLGVGYFNSKISSLCYGSCDVKSDYAVGEFGLAYGFFGISRGLKNLALTLGYRSQTITSKSVPISNVVGNRVAGAGSYDVRDVTQGPTAGVVAQF